MWDERKVNEMAAVIKRDWILIVIGVLLIICGVIFFFSPVDTLITLTIFAGAFFLVAGVFDIIDYVRFHKSGMMSAWVILYAVLDILIGLMLLIHPIALAQVIPWIIGAFVIVFGAFEFFAAFNVRKLGLKYWGWMLFSGIVGIALGSLFIFIPASVVIYLAVFLLIRGVSLIVLGWNAALVE